MAATFVTYSGSHTLDLVPLQGKLVDIEAGGMQGLRPDQPGFAPMALALAEAMPQGGAAAGIPQDIYDHFVMCNETVAMIDERLATALKQVEVLTESRAFYVDARQNDIGLMVDAMRSRAQRRKDPSLLVPFEKVIRYNAQIGDRAWRARRKKAEAQADAEKDSDGQGNDAPPAGALAQTPPAPPA